MIILMLQLVNYEILLRLSYKAISLEFMVPILCESLEENEVIYKIHRFKTIEKDIQDSIRNFTFFTYCECQRLVVWRSLFWKTKPPKCQSSLPFNVLSYLYYTVTITFSGYYVETVIFQKQIGCQRKLSIPKYIDLSPEGNDYFFLPCKKRTIKEVFSYEKAICTHFPFLSETNSII